jgi:hypothetical protein
MARHPLEASGPAVPAVERRRVHWVASHGVLDGCEVDADPETLVRWLLAYDCGLRAEREQYAGSV